LDADDYHNLTIWKIPYEETVLNGAVSGANLFQIFQEVDWFNYHLQNELAAYQSEWKLLTILIGANDLCGCCGSNPDSRCLPNNWIATYNQVLQYAYDNIPGRKVFVNVVSMFNISQVYSACITHPWCVFIHEEFHECGCLMDGDANDRLQMDVYAQQYNALMSTMAQQWNAKGYPDFTVSYQPVLQNMIIPNTTFLSQLDCFHPSLLAHEQFALSLWQSMYLPPGKKPTFFPASGAPLYCPTPSDRIQ